jgi:glycosyltransferase 2 family protein
MMPHYKIVQSLIWLFALAMAGLVLSRLPVSSITQTLSGLSLLQWAGWIILNLVIIYLYVTRWAVLIKPQGLPVNFYQLLLIRQAGQAISFVTPGPQFGGEPMQVYWLWKKYSCPGHSALLAVALDRFYELWINFTVLLFGILILLTGPAVNYANWTGIGIVLLTLIIALSLLGWMMLRQRGRVSTWIRRLASRWENNRRLMDLDTHWNTLTDELELFVANNNQVLILAFVISLMGWTGMIMEVWLLLSFFDLSLGFSDFIFLLVTMRLAFLLPLPGGIGTLEAALFWAFLILKLPATAAVGLIALMRLRDAVILGAGILSLRTMRISN